MSLNQVRLAHVTSHTLGKQGLEIKYKRIPFYLTVMVFPFPFRQVKVEGGVYVGVDVTGDQPDSIVAYKAKNNSNVIDLSKIRH
ncbi:MAG: hypothetical protein CM1200mP16_10420 [Nitrospina sp.]|nr:MAG: hypothetical protein CM1200mP16_10420 [Nitrospina sp.]